MSTWFNRAHNYRSRCDPVWHVERLLASESGQRLRTLRTVMSHLPLVCVTWSCSSLGHQRISEPDQSILKLSCCCGSRLQPPIQTPPTPHWSTIVPFILSLAGTYRPNSSLASSSFQVSVSPLVFSLECFTPHLLLFDRQLRWWDLCSDWHVCWVI